MDNHNARRQSRRKFIKSAAGISAMASIPACFSVATSVFGEPQEISPSQRPRIALIGCGGMGTVDAQLAARFGDIVALCDVDQQRLKKASETFPKAIAYADYRTVCELPSVDVILNGTPDHWHTLINLRAIQNGKDVYSEKPLTLTIDEGKQLVKAVRQTNRILQTGSQQRSDPTFRLACELVRNGRIGKVHRVQTWLPMGRHEGPFHEKPVPPGLNWDVWLGQTPKIPYVEERCHGTFRYWWDYSGGTMTDWGAHHNDIALWGLDKERSGPIQVEGQALIDPIPGGYTAASQYRVKYVYDDGTEHLCQSTSANDPAGIVVGGLKAGEKRHGVQFEGSDGWIYVTRGGDIQASDPELLSTPLPDDAERLYVSDDHMGNFFACVASRKPPICDVEIGHRSASICHLGVIAMRVGRTLAWDPVAETFPSDAGAMSYLAREMRTPYAI